MNLPSLILSQNPRIMKLIKFSFVYIIIILGFKNGLKAQEINYLPEDLAMQYATQYQPHYYWSDRELYFNESVEWVNEYIPAYFSFDTLSEITYVSNYIAIEDNQGNIISNSSNNLNVLSTIEEENYRLGWGLDVFNGSWDTDLPYYSSSTIDSIVAIGERFPLDHPNPSARIPGYFYAFYNADGNIEINYRLFAYRDDISYPEELHGQYADLFGGHWGDWEPSISVILNPEGVPLYTYYNAHRTNQTNENLLYPTDSPYHPRYLLWEDVKKTTNGHPVVLVAANKHAAFYSSQNTDIPSLNSVGSPSPINDSTTYRPQFLNLLSIPLITLVSEDVVGIEIDTFAGTSYPHLNWKVDSLVNLEYEPWTSYQGKWGPSNNSPGTPRASQHTIKDFVQFYRKLNQLPFTIDSIDLDSFYIINGPVYQEDLSLAENHTVFHNIFYSILKPLGFEQTQNQYPAIRFEWWNKLKIEAVSSLYDPESNQTIINAEIRNQEDFDILFFKYKWMINETEYPDTMVELSPSEFKPNSLYNITFLCQDCPTESLDVKLELYGQALFPNSSSPINNIVLNPLLDSFEAEVITSTTNLLAKSFDKIKVNCQPNPFQNFVEISWYGNIVKPLNVSIYDMMGRKIRTLSNENLNTAKWDGKNDLGYEVSKGVYFCTLMFEKGFVSQKIIFQ